MGKIFDTITPELAAWIEAQKMFLVGTAPATTDGHVNVSPKGLDTLRILGPTSVAYLDFFGSGAETLAHVRENQRIVFLFCAFEGAPKIVRLHGRGSAVLPEHEEWEELAAKFPDLPGRRAIIRAELTRIADSCGFGVPKMDYVGDRDTLQRSAEKKTEEDFARYRAEKNATSLDGLPVF